MRIINKKIIISDFICLASIGIDIEEQQTKQEVQLDLTIEISDKFHIKSDLIEDTINYHTIKTKIEDIISSRHYNLQETLIKDIANYCLKTFTQIDKITIRLTKTKIYKCCKASFEASFVR